VIVIAGEHDDIELRTELVEGDCPATALISLALRTKAGLIVVDSRDVGGFRELVMGSTSRGLIEHAPCPVVVVPRAVARA
jgi:nucleotide-binding universal stress UspA family protein